MARQAQQIARAIQTLLRLTRGRLPVAWIVVLAAALIGYLAAKPYLEASLGVTLPGLPSESTGADRETRSGPTGGGRQATDTSARSAEEVADAAGVLQRVGSSVYQSPAGLRYTRGSQHGHRLLHVMAHARDVPNRPGNHGVFEPGDAKTVVLLVDAAYEQAIAGRSVVAEREGGRVRYDVDMGRRIGFIGGQSGNRRGGPAATHLRLVLQGKNVITAFPVRP
ncbi:MAG: hypothetical protein AAF790_00870 [Planctomycetota bacterium]